MMKNYKKVLAFVLLASCTFFFQNIQAQLEVTGGFTGEELAEILVGNGVMIDNVVFTCPEGAAGAFNGEFTSLGMDEGIVLTSGSINNAVGPNDNGGESTDNLSGGDFDLDLIASFGTNDACVLEFDVTPFGDTLQFNYVFGSEEYLEYVDQFNDVFAFFISGPGFDGPYSNNAENIALIPGTDVAVTINNINDQDFPEFFVCNGDINNQCNPFFPADINSTIEYDGLTVLMTAIAGVTPCETYRLKLAVADELDGALDSGVFIEAKSLSVNLVTVSATTTFTTVEGFDNAVEGCVDGIVTFEIEEALDEDVIVEYDVTGSAVLGEDYTASSTDIVIPAGETSVDLVLSTVDDGVLEGDETIIIELSTSFGCDEEFTQEVEIILQDSDPLVVSDNVTIQAGESANLSASGGGFSYFWSPIETLTGASTANPVATPTETTTYTATTVLGDCVYMESVTVFVGGGCDASAGTLSSTEPYYCSGDGISVSATDFATDGYTQAYVLTLDNAGFTIVDVNTTGVFSGPNAGMYVAHALNIDNGQVPGDLSALIGLNAVEVIGTLTCFDLQTGIPFAVLSPVQVDVDYECDAEAGVYTLAVSFSGGLPEVAAALGLGADAYEYEASGDLSGSYMAGVNTLLQNTDNSSYSVTATDAADCSNTTSGTPSPCVKVAVELMSFEGRTEEGVNHLNWTTASETNNAYFEVQRSIDGVDFRAIGTVEAVGNSSVVNNYAFVDAQTPCNAIYRLAIADKDGAVEYSNTISLTQDCDVFGINNIAPIPATDHIVVSYDMITDGAVNINIIDVTGKVIDNINTTATTGNNALQLSVNSYQAGVYFISIHNGQTSVVDRFIVK